MTVSLPTGDLDAVVFTRRELPPPIADHVNALRTDLRRLKSAGAFATVNHVHWPNRVPLQDCSNEMRDTYLEFAAWAGENDRELCPYFSVRDCYDIDTDAGINTDADIDTDAQPYLVFPVVALGFYRRDSLVMLYPHREGSTGYSVREGLTQIERILDEEGAVNDDSLTAD